MNKSQKVVLAIFVPIIIFASAFILAHYASATFDDIAFKTFHNPFNWGKTWYIWLYALIASCFFDYVLFENGKEIKKGNKKIGGNW